MRHEAHLDMGDAGPAFSSAAPITQLNGWAFDVAIGTIDAAIAFEGA